MSEKSRHTSSSGVIFVNNAYELRSFLEKNHEQSRGVWLLYRKKSSGGTLTWSDIVDELLCFGWIDSKPKKIDDETTAHYASPRKPKSNWSKINKEKVARLITQKRMLPSGLRMVELAKRTGTWDALNDVDALIIPDELAQALDDVPNARAFFDAFPPSAVRGILEWIMNAKRPETRAKRIRETAELAQKNVRANQWQRPG